MWRHRTGVAECDKCVLCGTRDTYSHRVCTCKAVGDAVTLAHDHAWQRLYEHLVGHLSDNILHWYDTRLSVGFISMFIN